jgi:hypothetical protein
MCPIGRRTCGRLRQTFAASSTGGLERGGSFFLTYHRWAERRQIEAAYRQFADFLRCKQALDPGERFQSSWYRHHKAMFPELP